MHICEWILIVQCALTESSVSRDYVLIILPHVFDLIEFRTDPTRFGSCNLKRIRLIHNDFSGHLVIVHSMHRNSFVYVVFFSLLLLRMHSIDKRLRIPKIIATNRISMRHWRRRADEFRALGKFTVCEIKINICAEIYRTLSEIDDWVEFSEGVRPSRDVCNQLQTLIFTCDAKSDAIGAYYFVEVWRDVESSARSTNAALCLHLAPHFCCSKSR